MIFLLKIWKTGRLEDLFLKENEIPRESLEEEKGKKKCKGEEESKLSLDLFLEDGGDHA